MKCEVPVIGVLFGLVWCSSLLFKSIQTKEKITALKDEDAALEKGVEGQNQETEAVSKRKDQNIEVESKSDEEDVSLDKVDSINRRWGVYFPLYEG